MTDTDLFVQNSSKFSFELYNILSDTNKDSNLIFSPFSIQTCVALAFAGASGKTATEIAKGLHLVANDAYRVSESFKTVLDKYANSSLLKVANKMYVKIGATVKPEFNEIAEKSFHASSEEIDFSASEKAASTINKWVEAKTNNKITDLVSPDSLDGLTRLVLVNAIHFKGEWRTKFVTSKTMPDSFYLNDNDKVMVDMMNGKARYRFGNFEDLDCTALEMPYRDSDLSMLVLLPNTRTGLKDLESKLQNINLLELTRKMVTEEVVVKFPKFKVTFSTELSGPLAKLGMQRMFSSSAEFDKLLVTPEPLQVSKVIHKAFIEVDEEGSEAAAATACVVRVKRGLHIMKGREFIANHPFIYALISGHSNPTVLFLGAHVNPDIVHRYTNDEL